MTEMAQRRMLVDTAIAYLGCKESDGSHKKIIDRYNSSPDRNVPHKLLYTEPWCAGYASVPAIDTGMTDIIPVECSCSRMIECFKKIGCWVEDDSYAPKIGDYVFYDFQDNGVGDNQGAPDHVGIVAEVNGKNLRVIEGNKSDAVGYRDLAINGKYIRGYGVPKYGTSKATAGAGQATTGIIQSSSGYSIGEKVYMAGDKHYSSSSAIKGTYCHPGLAKITNIAKGTKHPYHLVKIAGGGSTVYGWVDLSDIVSVKNAHAVVKGDTLWGIAIKYLGSGSRHKEIMELNGLTGTTVMPGQILRLPEK